MTEHRDDKAFEDYLDGRSPLSDDYARLKDVGPSEELDRRILAEARREARHHGERTTARAWRPWPALATLAVVGIAVLLALDLAGPRYSATLSSESAPAGIPPASPPDRPADAPARTTAVERLALEDRNRAASESVARKEMADEAMVPEPSSAQSQTLVQYSAGLAEPERVAVEEKSTREQKQSMAAGSGSRPSYATVSEDAVAGESGVFVDTDLPASLADGDPADRARIAGALTMARERLHARTRAASTRVQASSPAPRERPAVAPGVAPGPDAAVQTAATATLADDPELWLEFIDVLSEIGMDAAAVEMARQYRDTFPERPLEPRHETLIAE